MLSHRKDTRWNHSVSNFIISKREIQSFPNTYRESCRLRHPVLVSFGEAFEVGQDCGGSDLGVVFSAGSQCLVFRYSTECLEKIGSRRLHGVNLECSFYF